MCYKGNDREFNIYAFDDVARYSCPHSVGITATYIIKPIANKITKWCLQTEITPNDMTFYSLVLGALAGAILCTGTYTGFLIGAILFFLSFTLDYVDGQIARIKNLCSEKGKYLDIIVDRFLDAWLVVGLTIGLSWHYQYAYIIGLIALIGVFMLAMVVYEGLEKVSSKGVKDFISESTPSVFDRLKPYAPTKDNRALLFLVLAILGQSYIALIIMALAVNIFWILLLYIQIERF